MTAKRPIRCAIYTRKSTEEGLEQDFNSLDAQREAGEAYVTSQKAEGWMALADRFDDGGYSGGTLERPALRRLMTGIEGGAIDVVVVYKIDRLSRSLMDFAKLVEVFDRKSVTFVSVTQSFNTTTSMGRLTLNVLLSFAQFEREVTGERIRDKFAASKKKGMWMGGNPPLGYDVANRKLVMNATEAETVRVIYQRYLDLGCVRLLCTVLAEQGIVSKRRKFESGEQRGGTPIGRSGLYAILNNRTYIGQTTHKGATYSGQHEAIVPPELFHQVQQRLAAQSPPLTGLPRRAQDAPFADLLFDETGAAMMPTYVIKHRSVRYRYYVSRPALRGGISNASISRIPAPPFEIFMARVMERLGLQIRDEPLSVGLLQRVEIQANSIRLMFDRTTALRLWREHSTEVARLSDPLLIDQRRSILESGESIVDEGDRLLIVLPLRAKFRGGRSAVIDPAHDGPVSPPPDVAILKAVARAHRWRQMLLNGEATSIDQIAQRFGLDRGHVGKTLNLAFLKPNLVRDIVRGAQPPGLRLTPLLDVQIPMAWRTQDAVIADLTAS